MMATREPREKPLLKVVKESIASGRAILGSAVLVCSSRVTISWMEKNYHLLNHCPISPTLNFMRLSLYTLLLFTHAFLMELYV